MMRVERFYHSAPSAAENNVEAIRGHGATSAAVSLIERAFPQGLELSAYALRKRLVCPRWWLIGVMSQWLAKDSDFLVGQLGLREGDFILSGSPLSAKTFPLIVSLWTELLAQLSSESNQGTTVELNLGRILKGTVHEVHEQLEFLTSYLSSALRIQKMKMIQPRSSNRRQKSQQSASAMLAPDSVGLVQIVENVVLTDAVNQKLVVTFTRDPRKLFSLEIEEMIPFSLLSHERDGQGLSACGSATVTLQPDVLQAMSRSLSPKKLIPYLSLELLKSNKIVPGDKVNNLEESVWRGRALGSKELTQMHKDQLVQARSFYDHGLLSWENEAPRQRVRALVGKGSVSSSTSGIVHCWRLSQHAVDAIQFEQALSSFLRSREALNKPSLDCSSSQPRESLPVGETSHQREIHPVVEAPFKMSRIEVSEKSSQKVLTSHLDGVRHNPLSSRVASERQVPAGTSRRSHGTVVIDAPITRSAPQKSVANTAPREPKNKDVWTDDEFLMCVADFYESLTPLQQQAFERERRRMSPEQFRAYVTPALMRHKIKNA
jgi:hypothetical protein